MEEQPTTTEDTASIDCWHCSLVSYRVSYLSAEAMHHFAGYILPGLVFSVLGLRWAGQLVVSWSKLTSEEDGREGRKKAAKITCLGAR